MRHALLATVLGSASLAFALDGDIGIHDPSTVILSNGKYYTYGTGGNSLVSDDGWTWRRGTALPRRGLAPDVIHVDDRYYVYVAANSGPTKADVNLITNKTLDPSSPDYKWEEGGVVASSNGVEDSNVIDPGVFRDRKIRPGERKARLAGEDAMNRALMAAVLALNGFQSARLAAADAVPTAAQTLSAPTAAALRPRPDGFIRRWLLLEPIPANGLTDSLVQAAVKKEYFPNQFSLVPHDADNVAVNASELVWHSLDTKNYNVNLYHFATSLGKKTSDVLFWAVTVIEAPQEMRDVRLAIGSNAASVWWVNGQEVIGIYGDRQTVIDDGVSKRLVLKKGPNVIRAAIVNGGGATDFCARILDAQDHPWNGFTFNLGLRL